MTGEPKVSIGLVENAQEVTITLIDCYTDGSGRPFSSGDYRFSVCENRITVSGAINDSFVHCFLSGTTERSRFRMQVTIGIDFHWQQKKNYTFCGNLRIIPAQKNRITVINMVPLETYILSVCSSEMNANSPEEFLKAHSVISRSWLLAQMEAKGLPSIDKREVPATDEIIRWYDRQAHTDFDVCADDHCQRYQGTDMITTNQVSRALDATRGMILMFNGKPCDARFSKCCGGITEDFRVAWGETLHPYLVPVVDASDRCLPSPPLSNENAARIFIAHRPDSYCNGADDAILSSVLNNYDRSTHDFFRWRVTLTPEAIAEFLLKKLSLDPGRVIALEPVERGLSGRLKKLRIVGDKQSFTIGKELEIRRALSPSHLYSSAFVIDTEGPASRPDTFILNGAGWGHGVGLCQIGAAVMAYRGIGYDKILSHYFPGSVLSKIY